MAWTQAEGDGFPALAFALAAVIGLVAFALVLGLSLVDADAPFWRNPGGDMAQMLAGYEALLHEPWGWPPTVTHRLLAPQPVSIVYTDSIPWLALLLKASGLGQAVNVLGLFYLLSYVLQPVAMVALLRALGARRWETLAAGALLAVFWPAWILRQFGHVALAGHWLILFTFAVSAATARSGLSPRRGAALAVLGALAVGIHPYHVVPVAAGAAAAFLSELTQRRPGALPRVLGWGAAFSGAVLGSAWVLGFGAGQGLSTGAAGLGFWSMNLVGPFLPQASALAGQHWDGSWYTGTLDPTGGQAFEGYAYLGAGVLLVVAAAAALSFRRLGGDHGARDVFGWLVRWGPLAGALIALTVFAVGPTIYAGAQLVATLPKPAGKLGDLIGMFRAHGRFFWGVGYMIAAVALLGVERRGGRRLPLVIGAAAVLLQAYDVSGLQAQVRTRNSTPGTFMLPQAFRADPRQAGRPVRVFPEFFCAKAMADQDAIRELALLATSQGGSSNTASTARSQTLACNPPPDELLRTAPAGDRTLTVVLNEGDPRNGRFAEFAGRRDCYVFSRGWLCGRDLNGLGLREVDEAAFAPPAPAGPYMLRFDDPKIPRLALRRGWSDAEPFGTWSNGPEAEVQLDAPLGGGDLLVVFDALGYAPDGLRQRAIVTLGGGRLAVFTLVQPHAAYTVRVPAELAPAGARIRLQLAFPDAVQPPNDQRVVAMGLRSIAVSRAR